LSILDELLEATDQFGVANTALAGLTETLGLLDNAASTSIASIQSLSKATAQFASDGQSAAKTAGDVTKAAGATGAAGGQAAKGVDVLGESAEGMLAKLKPSGGVLGKVTQALEALGPQGKAAAVVIGLVITVVTAAAVAFWNLAKAAVSISQEKDALVETFAAITDGAENGLDVVNRLSDEANKLGFREEKVLRWGKAMAAAGKSGDALVQSVDAIGASAAIMQDNGEAALAFSKRLQTAADVGEKIKLDRRMQRMLAETGVRATELAKALGIPEAKLSSMAIDAGKLGDVFERTLINKGAGALQKMSLTWDSITGKLGDAWDDLFEDLGPAVQPLMAAIRDLFGEFSAGTTLQGAAKGAMTSFFTTVLGWATRATRAIHIGFLEAQIAGLKVYIALAPLIVILRAIFTNSLVLRGIKIIFVLIAAAVGIVIAVFATMAAAVAVVGAIFVAVGSVIWSAILSVVGAIEGLVEAFITGGTEGASQFISGLVQGISDGVGAVVNAVKNLASNAEAAFTSFFQIKSPSRLMKAHGRQLPAGAAAGVDEGAIQLQKSMDDVWEMPKAKRAGARAGKSEGGNGRQITFTNCHFWDTDESKIRALWQKFLDQEEAAGAEPEAT
jgi:hypothetical protein